MTQKTLLPVPNEDMARNLRNLLCAFQKRVGGGAIVAYLLPSTEPMPSPAITDKTFSTEDVMVILPGQGGSVVYASDASEEDADV